MNKYTQRNVGFKGFGKEKNQNNVTYDTFLSTKVNFGVVMKCLIGDIDKRKKKYLKSSTGRMLLFIRCCTNRLWICEDKKQG